MILFQPHHFQYDGPNYSLELMKAPFLSPSDENLGNIASDGSSSPDVDDIFFNPNPRTIFGFSPLPKPSTPSSSTKNENISFSPNSDSDNPIASFLKELQYNSETDKNVSDFFKAAANVFSS